jgi:restriction system protein
MDRRSSFESTSIFEPSTESLCVCLCRPKVFIVPDKQGFLTTSELMWPTMQALQVLGGSGRNEEINEQVAQILSISEAQMSHKQRDDHYLPLIEYRIGWARTRLKERGLLENSGSGVWALTDSGRRITEDDLRHDSHSTIEMRVERNENGAPPDNRDKNVDDTDGNDSGWKVVLLNRLLELPPPSFERLSARLLREAGFRNVEVTGRSGDGGIDGVGVYQLSLVSFPIYFQCKRYKGAVSSGSVRDFRGAMSGRGEKGLLISTGVFTRDARDEASRDGAPPVELISGDELCGLLKQYSLGVKTESRIIEKVIVQSDFFDDI